MRRPAREISSPLIRLICLILCCAIFVPCFPSGGATASNSSKPSRSSGNQSAPGQGLPDLDRERMIEPAQPHAPDAFSQGIPDGSPAELNPKEQFDSSGINNASGLAPQSGGSDVYVSDLLWTYEANGWGPAERDRSNGEQGAADGTTLTLNGTTYTKGIGAHAYSEIRVNLAGAYSTFISDVGLDDEMNPYGAVGSIVFQVWADGTLLYDSGVMNTITSTRSVNVSVAGRSELKLIVTDGGDGIGWDHADWAGARLVRNSSDIYVSDLFWSYTASGYGPAERDKSNGDLAQNDGTTITLNGVPYLKGVGAHANSDIRVNLAGRYSTFISDVGLDDEMNPYGAVGSIVFQVWADGTLLYDSGVMNTITSTRSINVSVAGKNELRLVVTDGGDDNWYDHADWAGARLVSASSPPPTPGNNAAFVSQSVPTTMTVGQSYSVSVTMRNTGTNTWTSANNHMLGTQNPQDNTTWGNTALGFGRVGLPSSVSPGSQVTFNFTVTAPSTPGTYNFQRRMLQHLVEWFGDFTPNVAVNVTSASIPNNAAFVSQSVPTTMTAGQSYNVSVTMRNTGTNTWTSANNHMLGTQNPQDNTTWGNTALGFGRVSLPSSVFPGSQVTFNFTVTAPSTPGTYNFQRRMLQHLVEWFGDFTPNVVVSVTGGGGGGSNDSFSVARVDPGNRTGNNGEDLFSRNFNWSMPVLGLSGRAGLDLGLSLNYNSLVWTKAGSSIKFNADNGFPGPGFRLGFPVIQPKYFNSQVNVNAYLLITPSGGHVELRQSGSTNIYEAADSSYLQLTELQIPDNGNTLLLRSTDGTQLSYAPSNGEYRCTRAKDRNGNYISIAYNGSGNITTITDTLARTITFNYVGENLVSITQVWNGATHTWATFGYSTVSIQTNFPGLTVVGPTNGTVINVLTQVGLHDGSRFNFDYTSWGQVYRISNYAADSHLLNYFSYNLPLTAAAAQSDCPRFNERRDWAENWNNGAEAVTFFSFDPSGSPGQVTTPDNTLYKEFFATSGWQRGLPTQTESWSAGARKKWTTVTWSQDNTGLTYQLNPRVIEANVYDDIGNRRRSTISYTSFGLPSDISEYAPDGFTLLRRSHTDYNLDSSYTSRRIIGLPSREILYDGAGNPFSKIDYGYDWDTYFLQDSVQVTNHDPAYNINFRIGRGNLCGVGRWNLNAPTEPALVLWTESGYDINGSVLFAKDPFWHGPDYFYTDSFSDGISRPATLAYPTRVTDGDGYATTTQYHYDMGVPTRVQGPKGAVQTTSYDSAGRVSRVDISNGAYTRWVYPASQTSVQMFTLIQTGSAEFYSTQVLDGAGRVRASAKDFPGSAGGYSGQFTIYDVMGRARQQSNPTEMTSNWVPAGDDASTGFVYSTQDYDWKGRPTISTNTDGTTNERIYGGCGCAGGEQVTIRDEMNRRQRLTYDVLGRLSKTEILNFNLTVYSTATNTYNVRDQITRVSSQQGTSGTVQETQMTYDGYGRLESRKLPAETSYCTYTYYADGNLQKKTDARGASATYTYNGRHLVTGITYAKPATQGAEQEINAIPAVTPVAIGYDEAGNRIWMTDDVGRVDYTYDTWSRMLSETRQFTGLSGAFRLSYGYNLSGQLTSLTDPFNSQVGYNYDSAGQLRTVTGSGAGSVPNYITQTLYRAWGAPKQISYGNGRTMTLGYDTRLRVTNFNVAGIIGASFTYYADGRVQTARDLVDRQFDRAYVYDHMGRLTNALSGSEAGVGSSLQGPYRQTYQYDVWGNMIGRTGRLWSGPEDAYTTTYVNNRNTAWNNNASGQPTVQETLQNTYDAAGRRSKTVSPSRRIGTINQNITQEDSYDGDGQLLKQAINNTAKYLVRSSVLSGKVVTEVSTIGSKNVGNVYANGQIVARQNFQGVTWTHYNPTSSGERQTNQSGGGAGGGEYDPLHNSVGLEEPEAGGDGTSPGLLYPRSGDPTDLSGGCMVDFLVTPCSMLMGVLNGEAGVQTDPYNNPSVKWNERLNDGQGGYEVFHAFADGYSGYIAINGKYLGEGNTLVRGVTDRERRVYPDGQVIEILYWGWVEGPKAKKDSDLAPAGYASDSKLSDVDCDKRLARIFGGLGAIVGSTHDPGTLGLFSKSNPPDFRAQRPPEHGPAPYDNPNKNSSNRGGIIHIYGNAEGTSKDTGLYAPSGGNIGPIETTSGGNVQRRVNYSTGLTITFVHVIPNGGSDKNSMGSERIGNIGGPDGGSPGYLHTHIVFFSNFKDRVRVDPRKVFCGQ